MYEAVVPIYTYGTHTGYLMMGQTLTNSQFEKERIKAATSKYVTDEKELNEAISKISFHTREQILSIASIIDICAKYFEGDVKGSCELQLRALPLIEQLFCEVNPIPLKKAVELMGFEAGSLRLPLTEIEEEHAKNLAQAMKDFGIKLA